mmetsp:Transcript_1453/g.1920  ORF Transcript_1453/g.1920 Transcript_1453/m.1920 type:complete len:250 (-) Transcript_1453:307-1056(-)
MIRYLFAVFLAFVGVGTGFLLNKPCVSMKKSGIVRVDEIRRDIFLAATTEEAVVSETPEVIEEEKEVKVRPFIEKSSLISEVNADYEPLMLALQAQNFEEADQITRDLLIQIAGTASQARGYVYWTEAQRLPTADLITIEQLWNFYSDSKFGYTVQKDIWRRNKGVFDEFCRKLGWTTTDLDTGLERKRRWFGKSEFDYSLNAPKGHLPLTSALRGTQLLKALLQHATWESDDWNNRSPLATQNSPPSD